MANSKSQATMPGATVFGAVHRWVAGAAITYGSTERIELEELEELAPRFLYSWVTPAMREPMTGLSNRQGHRIDTSEMQQRDAAAC